MHRRVVVGDEILNLPSSARLALPLCFVFKLMSWQRASGSVHALRDV